VRGINSRLPAESGLEASMRANLPCISWWMIMAKAMDATTLPAAADEAEVVEKVRWRQHRLTSFIDYEEVESSARLLPNARAGHARTAPHIRANEPPFHARKDSSRGAALQSADRPVLRRATGAPKPVTGSALPQRASAVRRSPSAAAQKKAGDC